MRVWNHCSRLKAAASATKPTASSAPATPSSRRGRDISRPPNPRCPRGDTSRCTAAAASPQAKNPARMVKRQGARMKRKTGRCFSNHQGNPGTLPIWKTRKMAIAYASGRSAFRWRATVHRPTATSTSAAGPR